MSKEQTRSSFGNISEEFPNEDIFSIWENQILEKFRNSEISFRSKFRKFVIFLGKKKEQYIPDMLLEGFEYKRKEIVVEAHEKISEEDIKKYRRFRSTFGSSYYLIMIVSDEEIGIWKGHHKGNEGGVFNEIYTESEVDDLLVCLKKWKKDYDEMISEYGQYALCPSPPKGRHGCGVEAKGFEEITEIFGYRGKRVQSLCRSCRKKHHHDRRK